MLTGDLFQLKALGREFFGRPTLEVAQDLLGKFLVRRWRGKNTAFIITEVEAYGGFEDKASHAARGLTTRNKPMFGPAGRWYVYFTYGMHWMLNIVTGKEGYPAAILIRGIQGINGPARLTKILHIGKNFNNKPANRKTGLWIENGGVVVKKSEIKKGPRIGVDYAGPVWGKKLYRFWITSNRIKS
ncbi:MAG: 3-methyladenine DNA glycosylase [Candidatus Harrisonbacteria bacterium RIFCSPHIGHO2_01_FULL_44_13]|uniref:Putative 3-methyladenine DNA glycosylase n=1 Tax=Candidatus Harrisonbacteria bacterium RIFCSPLOWO2_01_FULL_44_18 TaxID=1798407 RepID=A0A1G1ZMZ4_9BACT|nr:MAG: 3-methyladenine DNA glycosylase [Candidatus Harrisonbacteria bacterium RIFCSPHIGHO2_01_FULL_44_13]OGY66023.1 MAG: 3-methyladenine DNA glycosylase [Candidatus Harrisonbacteria bacterium RIFCSPLOWO2_01_FULL_44_18]